MAGMLPSVVFLLFGGATADRSDCRALLTLVYALAAGLTGALFVLVSSGLLSFPLLIAFALALGTVTAFGMPARDALLSEVAGGDMMRAVTGLTLAQWGSQAVGNLLGSSARWIETAPALCIPALLFAAGIAPLRRVPTRAVSAPVGAPDPARDRRGPARGGAFAGAAPGDAAGRIGGDLLHGAVHGRAAAAGARPLRRRRRAALAARRRLPLRHHPGIAGAARARRPAPQGPRAARLALRGVGGAGVHRARARVRRHAGGNLRVGRDGVDLHECRAHALPGSRAPDAPRPRALHLRAGLHGQRAARRAPLRAARGRRRAPRHLRDLRARDDGAGYRRVALLGHAAARAKGRGRLPGFLRP